MRALPIEGEEVIAVVLAALVCTGANVMQLKADAQAKLAQVTTLVQELKEDAAAIPTWEADIKQNEAYIATERRNPSGVVDLAALHSYGEQIQYDRNKIAALVAEMASDNRQVKVLTAEVERILKACAGVVADKGLK